MKKTVKILIIVVAAILVLTGASLAYLYFKTDKLKQDDELFSKYSQVIMDNIQNMLKDGNIESYSSKKMNTPYENKGDVEIALQMNGASQNINIDSTILDFNGKVDNVNNKVQEDFNIHYSDTVLFPGSYVRDGEKHGITSNEIMRAYAVVENKNLKEFFEKLGIESGNIPNEINISDYENNIDENELQTLKQRYWEIIKNNLSKENFSKAKEETGVGYMLTIPSAQLKTIANQILSAMKEDDIIQKELETTQNIDNSVKTNYDNIIDSAIEQINELEEGEEKLVITVYETTNGITRCSIIWDDIECEINTSSNDLNIKLYNIGNIEANKESLGEISIKKESDINSIKYVLDLKMHDLYNDAERLLNAKFEISGINGNLAQEKITVVINQNSTGETLALGAEYNNQITFKDSIEITELNSSNAVILNDLSRDTLVSTMQQVLGKIQEVNENKIRQAGENSDSIISKIAELVESQRNSILR